MNSDKLNRGWIKKDDKFKRSNIFIKKIEKQTKKKIFPNETKILH